MTAIDSAPVTLTLQHLIGGAEVPSLSGETFESRDPHDGSLLARVPRGGAEDVQAAVTAARRAFDDGPWPRMDPGERQAILHRLADLVMEQADELALLETRDCGLTYKTLRGHQIPRTADNFRFFADYAALAGSDSFTRNGRLSYVLHPPAGVVAAISPWNAPLMLSTWKVAPALAFGNAVVLKPAEQTPVTAARLARLALEAGVPEGVFNVVHGFGPGEAGEALTQDPRVDRVTFTGSSETAKHIMRAAAANLTPVSFELGGKSANVVFADADLDSALDGSLRAIFSNNGEMCLAGSRLLVERSILEEFTERYVAGAAAMTVGDPKLPDTDIGPLVEAAHAAKVRSYVELGVAQGGTLLTGGAGDASSLHVPATVLGGMRNDMRAVREEIFGPVQVIIPFDDERDALQQVNDTPYGLAGMLWTSDIDRVSAMARQWRAGTLWVNCFFDRDLREPFGGMGHSGIGREGGAYSREFFTEPQAVVIRHREVR